MEEKQQLETTSGQIGLGGIGAALWSLWEMPNCVLKIDGVHNNVLLIHPSLQVLKIMSAACSARA